jgi:hypothetical protein
MRIFDDEIHQFNYFREIFFTNTSERLPKRKKKEKMKKKKVKLKMEFGV